MLDWQGGQETEDTVDIVGVVDTVVRIAAGTGQGSWEQDRLEVVSEAQALALD